MCKEQDSLKRCKRKDNDAYQNKESYGAVKKKSAHDALNSVQNVLEYSRIMNSPIAIAPKDATGCFDLLRREIIKVIQESKGMPKEFGECVVQTLHGMERHIRLAGKLSKKSFKYNSSNNIGGIGQGSGEGPQDGNDMIGLLKDIHTKKLEDAHYCIRMENSQQLDMEAASLMIKSM